MRSYFRKISKNDESGFTLIELLVVILIIGILAAVAVPVFLNQRKKGAEASMQSDLKNASLVMEQELTQNKGKYPNSIPSYDKQSANNQVMLVGAKSSEQSYCLKVTNTSYPELSFSYSSTEGGLLSKGVTCSDDAIVGTANNVAMSGKKVLVVKRSGSNQQGALAGINGAGVEKIDQIEENTLTLDKAKEYDMIFVVGSVWAPTTADVAVAKQYYDAGGKVFTDGNDTSGQIPFVKSAVSRQSNASNTMNVQINPTYATGTSPSFPYTFKASSFGSNDSWYCIKEVTPGTVIIADSVDPQELTERCVTMLAQTNGNGGQWAHIILAPANMKADANPVVSGVNWLLQ